MAADLIRIPVAPLVVPELRGSDGVTRLLGTVHSFEHGIRLPYSLSELPLFEYAFMHMIIT